MSPPAVSIVLSPDWTPPYLAGRARELEALDGLLARAAAPGAGAPVGVEGPAGAGSSVLARVAARRWTMDPARRSPGSAPGHLVAVRVRGCAGATGVAAGLLRYFDPGFRERGFSTAEILAGFLRRLLREDRPAIVLLDDLGPGSPDVAPIVRALTAPARFLPEGVDRTPEVQLVLVGQESGAGAGGRWRDLVEESSRFRVPELPPLALRAIALDRFHRASGELPGEQLVAELVARALADRRSVARLLELLRAHLLPASVPPPVENPHHHPDRRVLTALELACEGGPVDLRLVRAAEAHLARTGGARPLPTTTFWRRIVRLEQAGWIVREVRPGGPGGSTSKVRLLGAPRGAGGPATGPTGTLPGSGRRVGPVPAGAMRSWARAEPVGSAPPGWPPGADGAGRGPDRPARAI